MPGFLAVVFLPYLLVNYYFGRRMWQYAAVHFRPGGRKVYWLLFWAAALTPLAARMKNAPLPAWLKVGLSFAGDYWLAALYYFVLLWLLIDLGLFLGRRLGVVAKNAVRPSAVGLAVTGIVGALLLFGSWNARTPQITSYEVTIAKAAGDLRELRVVMVSDIHLGPIVGNGRLAGLVAAINGLQPDVVLLAGDIIDENVNYFTEQKMGEVFYRLTPRYGVWAAFGNHEYLSGKAEEVTDRLQGAGIKVLRDEYSLVAESFYIVGRDDRGRARFAGGGRRDLASVMAGVDRRRPVILIEHQPYELAAAAAQGVDLQVSGHTHVGQMFPNNFVTRRMFEIDWGLLRKGDYHVIVSSGFGTWGPPIRIGNRPEIVDIKIKFVPSAK